MPLVVGLDHRPRRMFDARPLDHVGGRDLVRVPLRSVAPVLLGDLVAHEGRALAALEPAQLLLGVDVEPELHDRDAARVELLLEVVDLAVRAQPVGLAAEALDALDEHAPVPGAVEDRDAPAPRHVPPEAPQVRLRALLLGRRGERHDAVRAGVERARDPTDGAALARGVRPLEHDQRAHLAEPGVARDQVQPTLQVLQLLVVLLLGDLQRTVDRRQDALSVHRRQDRRGHGRLHRRAFAPQPLLERVEQGLRDRQVAIPGVGALHDDPRRVARARAEQRVLRDLPELVVQIEMLPVLRRHAPPRVLGLLQRPQALFLLLLGEVEPELQDQRALVGEHPLEPDDLLQLLVELPLIDIPVRAVEDRPRVPRAEEDPELALGRKRLPVPPVRRLLRLLAGGHAHRPRRDVARVHPRVQQVDRLALARAIDAADDDDDRKRRLLQDGSLRLQQRGAQRRDLLVVRLLVDDVTELGCLEHLRLPFVAFVALVACVSLSARLVRRPSPTCRPPPPSRRAGGASACG